MPEEMRSRPHTQRLGRMGGSSADRDVHATRGVRCSARQGRKYSRPPAAGVRDARAAGGANLFGGTATMRSLIRWLHVQSSLIERRGRPRRVVGAGTAVAAAAEVDAVNSRLKAARAPDERPTWREPRTSPTLDKPLNLRVNVRRLRRAGGRRAHGAVDPLKRRESTRTSSRFQQRIGAWTPSTVGDEPRKGGFS
jgi:hypothetical protein